MSRLHDNLTGKIKEVERIRKLKQRQDEEQKMYEQLFGGEKNDNS